MDYTRDFSKRELTFPEDRKNALRGIFHVFERSLHPVYQLHSVPVLPPVFEPYTLTTRGAFMPKYKKLPRLWTGDS
jgi:hypothetical protein